MPNGISIDRPYAGKAVEGGEALGRSEAFLTFQERLSKVAPIDRPVLLVGERGTGKELAAARLHYLSGRWQHPLVALNCAALAPTLIEAELFGHEKGAFTGAQGRRAGRFEAADAGTLFLDEIGLIPIQAQEKILRVVEYGAFERVGGVGSICVNVRIVAATNADLPALVGQGRFKEDLLDRLSFEVLFLPPLREREGDILLLANHFAGRMAYELGRSEIPSFSECAVEKLLSHPWPGNIREMKNVVERAVYRSGSDRVDKIDFDPFRNPYVAEQATGSSARAEQVGGAASGVGQVGGTAFGAEQVGEAASGAERVGSSAARQQRFSETFQVKGVGDGDGGTGAGPGQVPGAMGQNQARVALLLDKPFPEAVRDLKFFLVERALEKSRFNQKEAARILGLTYNQFRGVYRKYKDAAGSRMK